MVAVYGGASLSGPAVATFAWKVPSMGLVETSRQALDFSAPFLAAGDLDGDGRIDLVGSSNLGVLRSVPVCPVQ